MYPAIWLLWLRLCLKDRLYIIKWILVDLPSSVSLTNFGLESHTLQVSIWPSISSFCSLITLSVKKRAKVKKCANKEIQYKRKHTQN
jgi:hypothetical protein